MSLVLPPLMGLSLSVYHYHSETIEISNEIRLNHMRKSEKLPLSEAG